MPINEWPVGERPREKLAQKGARALTDAELLAIVLRTGMPGKSALDLARDLLTEHGGLRRILDTDHRTLCRSSGLGMTKAAQLSAALEIGQRYLASGLERGAALTSPGDTRRYLLARMQGRLQEVFACLYLDCRHRVIGYEEMFFGTIDGASVHPREIVRRCLHHNAAALIVAHNHPSGVAEPSQADRGLTDRLVQALALIDVRVLDHVVVGDTETASFAELGLL